MTKGYNASGEAYVSLGWIDRGFVCVVAAAVLTAVGWVGKLAYETREEVVKMGVTGTMVDHELGDHEIRIRDLEKKGR